MRADRADARVSPVSTEVPPGVCLACFGRQERYVYPYWVFCRHEETLAVVWSTEHYEVCDCPVGEIERTLRRFAI